MEMKNIKLLSSEFDFFWRKIQNNENFAFMRNADGELAIIEGRHVVAQEGNWQSPDYISKLGIDLSKSLSIVADNVYYAISCPCCDRRAYYWYTSRILNRKNTTFANLWINKNFSKFKEEFPKLKRDAVLIANFRAENKKIGNLNILKHYKISDDCISFWENDADKMIKQIISDFGNRNDLLYVVSAGPMSGPIIAELYKNNPNNCYVDFGSSIDPYYRQNISRPYMKKSNVYAKRDCWMYDSEKVNFDVTCVCNLYKRPESLVKQVTALENQSLKPDSIILFQDGIAADYYKIELLDSLRKKFSDIRIATENTGVWERFRFAKDVVKTTYVCVFDDDTIPGDRWLENCHFEMQKQEGIFGTNGVVMRDSVHYPLSNYFNVGWHSPVTKTTQVDFVGHSWFMPKKCLNYMFDNTDEFQKLKYVGEDMCVSVKALAYGIKTYIPPHPQSNRSLWGSLPFYGKTLGNSVEALSINMNNLEKMKYAVTLFVKSGWKPLCLKDKTLVWLAYRRIIFEKVHGLYPKLRRYIKRFFGKN